MSRKRKTEGAMVEVENGETAAAGTQVKVKKERTGFYMVMGCDANGQPVEVLKILGTIGRAERWLADNNTLVGRLYPMSVILRCKPVPPRQPDLNRAV